MISKGKYILLVLKKSLFEFVKTRIFWHYAPKNPSPCGGWVCGPSAHDCMHVQTPGVRKSAILTIFGPALAKLEDFLTEKKKSTKLKNCILS